MSELLEHKIYYKRNLPHYQPEDAILFVTYRLAFSLPSDLLEILISKRKEFDRKLIKVNPVERKKEEMIINKILFQIEDEYLDKYSSGPLWLKNDQIAELVIESLLFNHNKSYELHYCIVMPNHVHLVLKPIKDKLGKQISIAKIMKEHKSFTAVESNKILHRSGQFWLHENYDHVIRNDEEYYQTKYYVLNNPVKAGFINNYKKWKYYYINQEAVL